MDLIFGLSVLLRSLGPVDGWDTGILVWIQEHLTNPFFDAVLPFISHLVDKGWIWIVLSLILICIPKTRKIGWTMGVALLLGLIFGNGILKNVIARTRPYDLYPELYHQFNEKLTEGGPLRLLVAAEHDLSMPSGHTLASFEGALGLFLRNKKWGAAALVFAVIVAYSRLYVCVHYPTDVFAGVLLGVGFREDGVR
ncbi:MAG: phosphatase PAP2 family protein, partial [Clostridia bacterium]|nr:phosphatase PAP2 family protein [Clostridia bacterium]